MRKWKKIAILLFVLVNGYAILCGGLFFFQENLLFRPSQLPQDYTFTFDSTFEEITLDAPDGAQLHGLYFTTQNPKGLILYYHGNAGDVSRWGQITQYFVNLQYDLLVMDYRQYGKSTGVLSEEALYADSELWYAFAKSSLRDSRPSGERSGKAKTDAINNVRLSLSKPNNSQESISSHYPLIIYGRSLGSTFATYVASRNEVSQLILETPFYSIQNEAKSRFPFLPVTSLLKYNFPTYKYINNVKAPITVFHGTEDRVVAYDNGKRLFDSIASANKLWITVPEGGHNDLINYTEYQEGIKGLLEN